MSNNSVIIEATKTKANKISEIFANQKAFIAFLTAGDPNLDKTEEFILAMAASGADLIEIGIPFSDPIAEGPVIEAANELFPDLAKAVNLYDTSLSEGAQANGLFTTSLEKMKTQAAEFTSQIDGVQSSLKTLQDVVSEYNETGLMSVDMVQQLLELDPEYVALLDFIILLQHRW